MTQHKPFALRIVNKKVYPAIKKMADKKYMSVNSLINLILEEKIKTEKNERS